METIDDYDRFKVELRKLESELKQPETKPKTCFAAQKTEERDYSRLESIVMQLKEKIDQMETDKNKDRNRQAHEFDNTEYRRPTGDYRGHRGRYDNNYRGRGHTARRPLAGNTFRGACYSCGDRGHLARDCPADRNRDVTCYRCRQQGHFAKECHTNLKTDLKE